MKIVVVNKHTIQVEIRCALLLPHFFFLQETPHHVYLVMEVCGDLPFFLSQNEEDCHGDGDETTKNDQILFSF